MKMSSVSLITKDMQIKPMIRYYYKCNIRDKMKREIIPSVFRDSEEMKSPYPDFSG